LEDKYLYLAVNFFSIIFPLLFSSVSKFVVAHHQSKPKVVSGLTEKWRSLWTAIYAFASKWQALSIAIIIPGILFLIWDEWFTQMGVWGFTPRYLTGITLGSLPLEELLFFICIPYASVFTYEAVNHFIKWRMPQKYVNLITDLLFGAMILLGSIHYDKWYTATTFILLALLLALFRWVWKPDYLGKFYVAFIFILIPFFITNGILTGTGIEEQVVWYNDAENLGIRMGTIPVEDTFYGMLMLVMNISILEYLQKKKGLAAP
jgi:lycopene cyclase domain-containing protein